MFLKGFISKHWSTTQALDSTRNAVRDGTDWAAKLINSSLSLYGDIWNNRNEYIHGSTIKEAHVKARESIIRHVRDIYKCPPKLARRYASVTEIPLDTRLRKNTGQLRRWFDCLKQRIKMSDYLLGSWSQGQLMIQHAFAKACRREPQKYPP
jgi:hypothetical protein